MINLKISCVSIVSLILKFGKRPRQKIGAGAFRDCTFLATFAVEHTEEAFAAVEKGADWNLNCTFEITYAQN